MLAGSVSQLNYGGTLMTQVPSRWRRRLLTVAACGAIAAALPWLKSTRAQSSTAGGISSSPIVLDRNDQLLLVVNPDNNTLTGIMVGNDNYQKLFEVPTGKEPQSVALSSDNTKAYVANAVDGTVTVHTGGALCHRQNGSRRHRALGCRHYAQRSLCLCCKLFIQYGLCD